MPKRKTAIKVDPRTKKEYYVGYIELPKKNGKRQRKTVMSLKSYGYTEFARKFEKAQQQYGNLKSADGITLSEYFDQWFEIKQQQLSYNTLRDYQRLFNSYIRCQIGDMVMSAITADVIQLKVIDDEAKRKDGTVKKPSPDQAKRVVKLLKNIYSYAMDMGDIESQPRWRRINITEYQINTDGTKSAIKYYDTREKVSLTKEEQRIIENCIDDHLFETERDRIYMILLAHYGLRREEACALVKENFYFDDNTPYMYIEHALAWKNNKPIVKDTKSMYGTRKLPLRKKDISALQEYVESCDNALFDDGQGGFTLESTVRSRWEKSIAKTIEEESKKCGVPYLYHPMHEYRHTFATILDELGFTPAQKKAYMGDNTEKVINGVYTHRDSLESSAIDAIESYEI